MGGRAGGRAGWVDKFGVNSAWRHGMWMEALRGEERGSRCGC
jgi:hypothetical protein